MLKAVVFDMDGTILDSLDDLKNSINRALRENGLPERSRNDVRAFLGKGMVYLTHKCVPEGTDEETETKVLNAHKEYYPLHCAELTKPYPGIPELLAYLKDVGIKTAVVSNKTDENVKRLAEKYFDGLFTVTVGAREGVPHKPARDLIDIALNELQVSEEEAVYVGDSDIDVATAKSSDLDMITVLWGFRDKPQLLEAGADCFAENIDELRAILDERFK